MKSRDELLKAVTYPEDVIDVLGWGSVRVRGISLGSELVISFVEAPVDRPVVNPAIPSAPKAGEKATVAERTAVRVAHEIVSASLQREWSQPSEDEKFRRRIIAAVVLGLIDIDGNRVFTWDDATALRTDHWQVCVEIATKVFELSGGVALDEGKDSSESIQDSDASTGSASDTSDDSPTS